MKNRIAFVLCLILLLVLSGCAFHEHTWVEASCTEPRTCSECGETEGEALGHSWAKATCEKATTCTICGVTEGEPLGHSWTEYPMVDAPISCTLCGETQGDGVSMYCPVEMLKDGDTYTLVTFDEEGNELSRIPGVSSCRLAEANDGTIRIIADVKRGDSSSIIIYDLNGEEVTRFEGLYSFPATLKDGNTRIFIFAPNDNKTLLLSCYDLDGELIYQIDNLYDFSKIEYKFVAVIAENDLYKPVVYDFDGTKSFEFSPEKGFALSSGVLKTEKSLWIAQLCEKDNSIKLVVSDIYGDEIFSTEWFDGRSAYCLRFAEGCFMVAYEIGSGESSVRIFDYSGTILKEATYTVSRSQHVIMSEADEHGVARIYDNHTDHTLLYVDAYSGQEVPAEQAENGNYVSNAWGYYQSVPDSDRSFVGSVDRTRWGFLDKDGKELATYADASNFNRYGYALASNDGENYFLIDKDFHIISEELPGISGAVNSNFFDLHLEDEKGNIKLFIVR